MIELRFVSLFEVVPYGYYPIRFGAKILTRQSGLSVLETEAEVNVMSKTTIE